MRLRLAAAFAPLLMLAWKMPGVNAADNILERSRAVYTALSSYSDTGVVVHEYGTGSKDRHTFSTSFRRAPRGFLFDFRKQGGDRYVIWGDPAAFHTWWKTTGHQDDYPNPSNTGAFTTAGVHTISVSAIVPSLLYARGALPSVLANFTDGVVEGLEVVGGRSCHRLAGTTYDTYSASGRRTNTRKLTVWIDAESLLIRKVLVRPTESLPGHIDGTTTTFEPLANPAIDDAKLRFAPPAGNGAAVACCAESAQPRVPLREGLTIARAYRNPDGDFEAITTVKHADAASVTFSVSTDERTDTCGAGRSLGARIVSRADLENARGLRQEFAGCPAAPEQHPGTTAIGVSSSVLRELDASGRTTLNATTRVAGMVPGTLARLEHTVVPFAVIVNDEIVELPAVHALWESKVGAREYWILNDAANPLVLRATHDVDDLIEIVRISYPLERTTAGERIARDLAADGRAILYGISFDFGSDRIKEESDATLIEIAAALRGNPSWSLAVEGHTDNIGGDAYNLDLSKRRAAAVRQALVTRYKVDGTRLHTRGYGASRPKGTNDTLDGRARNRRVELVKL